MKRFIGLGVGAILFLALLMGSGIAQVQTGSIMVRVKDPEGEPMPGVTVTVQSPMLVVGQVVGITDADGVHRFPGLPPGVYTIRFEVEGFTPLVREGIRVQVAQTTVVEVSMRLAGAETITVVGESPVVDITTTKVSTNISSSILQEIPGGRDIWNLLEYKVPSLVSSRIDVGGSESGLQAGFVAKGTPHAQNTQALNGVNVTDPEALGFADFYYDYDSFEEVQVITSALPVEVGPPGVYVNMVTKRGTDRLTGQMAAYWQGEETQSNNVTPELEEQGIEKAGFDFLLDASFQLGGPLIRDKLRFFTSNRIWRVHRFVPGFVDEQGNPVVESTDMPSILFNLTFQPTENHSFDLFYTRQWYDKPQRGASAFNTPLSNWKEDDTFDIYQVAWNGLFGENLFVDARVSFVDILFPLFIKEEAKRRGLQSTLELTTNKRTGSNFLELIFNRHRLQSKIVASYFVEEWLGVRHEFRFGWDFAWNPNSLKISAIDDVNLFTLNGQPIFVILWNTPVHIKRTTQFNAVFVSDTFYVGRFSFYIGFRLENARGWLPEQSSPAGTFAPERRFDRINVINWTNLSPRFGVIVDLTGDGKTALKFNIARYYHHFSTGLVDDVNPNGLGGEFRLWFDLNGDKKFQPGEEGPLLAAFGGLRTSLDPDIQQPFTDELVVGLERELWEDFRVGVTFTARRDRRLIGTENIGARWIPTQVVDPETGQTITVFNQDPATLGQDRFLVRNAPELDQNYVGLEIVAEKRLTHRFQMIASLTLSRTVSNRVTTGFGIFGIGAPAIDPNDLVNAKGRTFWDRPVIFKLSGSYLIPKVEVLIGGNVRIQSGRPFNRFLRVQLNQGFETIFAVPPGESRYDTVTTLDARVAKVFRLGQFRLDLMLDVYNITNANTVLEANELTGPAFGRPTRILFPRILRGSIRLQWF